MIIQIHPRCKYDNALHIIAFNRIREIFLGEPRHTLDLILI